jgi:UDPglucose 6-dehydrogenase
MRIGILGYGYVGSAVAWAHRTDDVIIRDPKLKDSAGLDEFVSCDAIYVCLPSPPTEDGHCDTSILEQGIKELLFAIINKPIPIICKSTAPPRFYEKLQAEYPNIVHSPEFLTAKNNIQDYLGAEYFVLGGEYNWCVEARKVIQHSTKQSYEQFLIVPIKVAALYKYMMNCYLATKVTFMNDFKTLADAHNIEWNDLKYLADADSRIGRSHMNVPGDNGEYGWAGACFPKDVSAIIEEAIDLNVDFELMDRVESINKKHRRKTNE